MTTEQKVHKIESQTTIIKTTITMTTRTKKNRYFTRSYISHKGSHSTILQTSKTKCNTMHRNTMANAAYCRSRYLRSARHEVERSWVLWSAKPRTGSFTKRKISTALMTPNNGVSCNRYGRCKASQLHWYYYEQQIKTNRTRLMLLKYKKINQSIKVITIFNMANIT